MKPKVLEYKDRPLRGNIELGPSRAIIKSLPGDLSCFWPISHTRGKVAVFGKDVQGLFDIKAERNLYYGSYDYKRIPKQGDKIFFSSACTLPRTLVRPEYKITMKPEGADYVILPNILDSGIHSTTSNIAVEFKDKLIFIYILKNGSYVERCSQEEVELIKKELDSYFGEDAPKYYDYDMNSHPVSFIRKMNEVREIVEDTYPTRQYIYERYLHYDTPTKISEETLFLWSKMADDMREKMLISSDWMEYPYTVWNFIKKYGMSYGTYSQSFMAMRSYLDHSFQNYDLEKNYVTPKDWNMLQKWIMKLYSISDNCGVMTLEDWSKLTSIEKGVIKKRVAVKPYILDEGNNNRFRIGDIM